MNTNDTMMQFFEWYLPADCTLWNKLKNTAPYLKELGVSYVWMPPAYKGSGGIHDVGYGVYDLYDLGEFDQKGSIPTKYGTRNEYLEAIVQLQQAGIEVYGDIVLDHLMGADKTQTIKAVKVNWEDRFQEEGEEQTVEVWTKFTYPRKKS